MPEAFDIEEVVAQYAKSLKGLGSTFRFTLPSQPQRSNQNAA